jgi:hypothetical protein
MMRDEQHSKLRIPAMTATLATKRRCTGAAKISEKLAEKCDVSAIANKKV